VLDAQVFRDSAVELDALVFTLLDGFNSVDVLWSDAVVSVSRLRDTITRMLDATHGNRATVIGDLQALAAECRRRAVVCDLYEQELASYRSYQRQLDAWNDSTDRSPNDRPTNPGYPSRPDWLVQPAGRYGRNS
jgi:hypothetical protein